MMELTKVPRGILLDLAAGKILIEKIILTYENGLTDIELTAERFCLHVPKKSLAKVLSFLCRPERRKCILED